MVSLKAIQESNAHIPTSLPPGLVAVFVGGTSGIGEYTLKEFDRYTRQPRIYNIGRSQAASDRIEAECKTLNPEAQYTFIQADVSFIRTADEIWEKIKAREKSINILCLSAGTLVTGQTTKEGLHLIASLKHHSRARFIQNLLPLLQAATDLRRVLCVLSGSKEGPINMNDLQSRNLKGTQIKAARGHTYAILTLNLAHFAAHAPTVSFIHDFPGCLERMIARGLTGVIGGVFRVANVLGPLLWIPEKESGERHLFFLTSERYKAKEGFEKVVPVVKEVGVARGIDGLVGSGLYSAD